MQQYDDGLDDDGYPIVNKPAREYYGSEADVGKNFNPNHLGGLASGVLERAAAAVSASVAADSPIETILGAAIILCFERGGKPLLLAAEPSRTAKSLLLVPQFRWLHYRSDWAIYNPKTTGALLIECDGIALHSSAEALAHDEQKDQAARNMGFLTMRFSGSQIHRDADQCASSIFNLVYGGRRCS